MEDIVRQLVGYARAMWLYRWWGLLAAWVVGIAAAVGIYMLPDRYESSARIFVDTQSVLKPLMSGLAVQPNIDQQVTILSRTLISRPNIEKLIRMADLDLAIKNDKDREALIDKMTRSLAIRSTGRDNLFTLSFQDEQAERARRVVQSFVSIFVESGLGDKRKDTDTARRFIEEQISGYEQKLEEAENRLKEFKLKNMAMMGEGRPDYFAQLSKVTAELEQARLQLRESENSRDALKRQLLGEEPVLLPQTQKPSLSSVSIPEIDGRIETLKKNLDAMLQRFTEAHPDVVGTRRVITQLEEQKRKEIEERSKDAPAQFGSLNSNPVYQQMKLAMGEAEANVASLQARVSEYQRRYDALRQASQLVPQIEAEFAQLNRDYEVNKKNYESLIARRESANMSVEMESTSGIAEFRLIDPPSVPLKPAAPNRVLLMPVGGVAALAAGLALMFLLSQLRPSFQDARVLREISGLPLLGAVSMLPDINRKRKARNANLFFAGGLTGLIGCFAVLTVMLAVMQA